MYGGNPFSEINSGHLLSPPVSGPPVSGPPVSGPPVSGPPVSGPPVSGPPPSGFCDSNKFTVSAELDASKPITPTHCKDGSDELNPISATKK